MQIQFADLGDFLYIIIFLLLLFGGSIEKLIKNRKQQQNRIPEPQDSEFGESDAFPEPEPAQPRTLEDLVKTILQQPKEPEETENIYPVEAQSLEEIPVEPEYYHTNQDKEVIDAFDAGKLYSLSDNELDDKDKSSQEEYEFDIRKAVIASEILNRKY